LETFVKLDDLVRVHVIDRSIHSPGAYVFGEIFNLARNNLNINKELVRHGLAESAPTTLSSCDSEYFLLAQKQPEQRTTTQHGLSRDRRSVPQHCSAPRSEIEQEECQHVIDDRHYNYMTIVVSTVAIVAFVANFEA
jgi:endonuclease YncB( thermonuclease family)